MNRTKAIFVTALMALMLAMIFVGLYMLGYITAHRVVAGVLGIYGFLCGSAHFCRWLEKEKPLELPLPKHTETEKLWEPDQGFTATYDDIMAELNDPIGGGDA